MCLPTLQRYLEANNTLLASLACLQGRKQQTAPSGSEDEEEEEEEEGGGSEEEEEEGSDAPLPGELDGTRRVGLQGCEAAGRTCKQTRSVHTTPTVLAGVERRDTVRGIASPPDRLASTNLVLNLVMLP